MLIRIWQKVINDEKIRVFVFQQLENNYSYLVEIRSQAILIDAGESGEILGMIKEEKLDLKAILLTHYHEDHIAGVEGILKELSPQVVGPNGGEVAFVDSVIFSQEELIIGPFSILAIGTPGHTLNHLCYYLPEFGVLFSGDMIFPCGCGKILEGSYPQMLESIKTLKSLPDDTYIFSGHEYSIENLTFALSLESNREEVREKLQAISSKDQYSVPTTIKLEKNINPFFRTDDPELKKILKMNSSSELDVLVKLKQLQEEKD